MKKLFILAIAIFAFFGFTTMAFADAKVLKTGQSTSCSGDIIVKSLDGAHYPEIAVTSGGKTRHFFLNPGFVAPQQMEFSKDERQTATGGNDGKVTNVSAGSSKIKVICK